MKTETIAEYGLLAALAMVLSYVESQIPVFFTVPGMKLGLTNLVVLAALYRQGEKGAFAINLVRIILVGATFGNMASMMYSIAGGFLSWIAMVVTKKSGRFSVTGVSIVGGIFHNIGQILVAMFVLESARLIYYLPFLLVSGVLAGGVIGLLTAGVLRRMPKNITQ